MPDRDRVGWTGTRTMTPAMAAFIEQAIDAMADDTIIVTGGCVGVDAYVAAIASQRGLHVHTVMPANRAQTDPNWRQHCLTYEEMPPGTTYRARNQQIVKQSNRIYAVPAHPQDHPRSRRSGTWQTIRLAQRAHVPVYVFIA